MIWVDYNIESFPDGSFTVKGEWPGEVMGLDEQGKPGAKSQPLYRPGDVFIVQENGILKKQEDLTALILKYESSKNVNESST
jgi:hypothetical protein